MTMQFQTEGKDLNVGDTSREDGHWFSRICSVRRQGWLLQMLSIEVSGEEDINQ